MVQPHSKIGYDSRSLHSTVSTDQYRSANKPDIILRSIMRENGVNSLKYPYRRRKTTPDSQRRGQKVDTDRVWGVKAETWEHHWEPCHIQ